VYSLSRSGPPYLHPGPPACEDNHQLLLAVRRIVLLAKEAALSWLVPSFGCRGCGPPCRDALTVRWRSA